MPSACAHVGMPEWRTFWFVHTLLPVGVRPVMNDILLGTHTGDGQ